MTTTRTMQCAVCPVCAAAKGLTKPRAVASATGDLFATPSTQTVPFRDTLTLDLFA